MKRRIQIKRCRKVFGAGLAAVVVMAVFTGCGNSGSDASVESEPVFQQESSVADSVEATASYFGEITSIDGETITLALLEKLETPREMQLPEIESGEIPSKSSLEEKPVLREQSSDKEVKPQLTGENLTVATDENTIITLDGESASLADLKTGDTVTIIMEGEKANSVIAGMMPQGERP